jgi:hypothetical protein
MACHALFDSLKTNLNRQDAKKEEKIRRGFEPRRRGENPDARVGATHAMPSIPSTQNSGMNHNIW